MQRAPSERIARQKEAAALRIPEGKRVIAEEMIETPFFPALDRSEKDRGIAKPGSARGRNIEAIGKVVAVVEAEIGNQNEPTVAPDQRLAIESVFRKRSHQAAAKRYARAVPLPAGVGTINFLGAEHARATLGGVALPFEVP
jgi:hypothetical protein